MLRIAPEHKFPDEYASYIAAFIEKYGLAAEVPVLELLDRDNGLGIPADFKGRAFGQTFYTHRTQLKEQTLKNFLRNKTTEALKTGKCTIEITATDIDKISNAQEGSKSIDDFIPSFELFLVAHLSNLSPVVHLRLSWCYGAVAILHSLYLAAQALENQELVFWTLEKAKIFSKISLEYTQLSSPTICHGYAGLLLTFEAFYRDTNDNVFSNIIETLQSKLLALYSPLHKYGFLDVDRVNGKLKKTEGVNFLTGTSGVILALSSHYYDSSMVLRHLLLN